MKEQTLKDLRTQAKARGLKGYSRMSKDELLKALSEVTAPKTETPSPSLERRARPRPKSAPLKTPTHRIAGTERAAGVAAAAPSEPASVTTEPVSVEEMVESAKYVTSPVHRVPTALPVTDLQEDIDRLPELTEPAVCLLPQKPGVLYAYWWMRPEENQRGDYKLRLARAAAHALEVYEEIPVRSNRGNWYFHLDENLGGRDIVLQLGYYRDGSFVTAQGQSVARLPSLYASTRTDHRWWVSEQEFASMYARAGGVVGAGRRYQWFASTGSPVGAPGAPGPGAPEERLQWPGGVSSRGKQQ
ncbi:MAG: DUF4912 domain-containing protein [Sulfurifustaceae bacterium]